MSSSFFLPIQQSGQVRARGAAGSPSKRSGRSYMKIEERPILPRFLVTLCLCFRPRSRECIYLHVDSLLLLFLLSSHLGRAPLCPKRARWFQVSSHLSFLDQKKRRKKPDFGAQVASITRQHDRALSLGPKDIRRSRRKEEK